MNAPRAALAALIGLAACAAPPAPSTPSSVEERPELEWLPDGSAIAVDGRWLFDPEHGSFVRLHCGPDARTPCRTQRMAFAPRGFRYASIHEDRLTIGHALRPDAREERLPRWLPDGSDEISHAAFWFDEDTLFVQQQFTDGHASPECGVRAAANGEWQRPAGGCLSPELNNLGAVDVGPGGLLALHASAEGVYGLSIVRYDLARGQSASQAAPLALLGASTVWLRFAPDGASVDLVSPCTLDGSPPPPCYTPFREPVWKLYSMSLQNGAPELRRADLPPSSALDPQRDRVAYVGRGALCLRALHGGTPRCVDLPRR